VLAALANQLDINGHVRDNRPSPGFRWLPWAAHLGHLT
jgi:hypothetical protein